MDGGHVSRQVGSRQGQCCGRWAGRGGREKEGGHTPWEREGSTMSEGGRPSAAAERAKLEARCYVDSRLSLCMTSEHREETQIGRQEGGTHLADGGPRDSSRR